MAKSADVLVILDEVCPSRGFGPATGTARASSSRSVVPRMEAGEKHMSQFNRSSGFAGARAIMATLIIVGVALLGATAHAAIMLTPAGTAQGLILSTFASGFPQTDAVGPLGIGFTSTNGVMVS